MNTIPAMMPTQAATRYSQYGLVGAGGGLLVSAVSVMAAMMLDRFGVARGFWQ